MTSELSFGMAVTDGKLCIELKQDDRAAQFFLPRPEARSFLAAVLLGMTALPAEENETEVMVATNPALSVSKSDRGDRVLTFWPKGLPPISLMLSAESAATLAEELQS